MGPPPPQLTLLRPPSQLPQSQQPPSQEPDGQETYSPGSPSSDEGDSMSARSSKLQTPTLLKVRLPLKKGKKTKPGGTPDKEPTSQPGFPFGDDNEEESVITVSDEEGSDKVGASTSIHQSVPTSVRK